MFGGVYSGGLTPKTPRSVNYQTHHTWNNKNIAGNQDMPRMKYTVSIAFQHLGTVLGDGE